MPFSSGIILCSHLFTCYCTDSTDFRSTEYADVSQYSAASSLCLASTWRRPQAIKSRLISTLNWIIYYVGDRLHMLTLFMIFVSRVLLVLKI
jgi:hypothetical protein